MNRNSSFLRIFSIFVFLWGIMSYAGKTDDTQKLMSYLGALLEQQVMGDSALQNFIEGLEDGKIVNPIPHMDTPYGVTFTRVGYEVHYDGVQEYLDHTELDRKRLLQWALENLKDKKRVRIRREETRKETQSLYQKMVFNRVEPGTFEMREEQDGGKVKWIPVTITQPYELMATKVTQWQWSLIQGSNPSYFKDGDQAIELSIAGNKVKMQPDHPVESVSWEDGVAFAEKLTEMSKKDDPILYELIADHQKGDEYRLPTWAERKFVLQRRGQIRSINYFRDDEAQLEKEYACYFNNSQEMTYAVGSLWPLVVEGKKYYDMYGRLWEWVSDWYGPLKQPRAIPQNSLSIQNQQPLIDPQGCAWGSTRVIAGGFWDLPGWGDRCGGMRAIPGTRNAGIGVRLVRIRKP